MQDALTLFDEGGLIVASSDPALTALLTGFQWKELFWLHREELQQQMRFLVFGHALYEKLLAPFVGVTGKAALFEVAPSLLRSPLEEQVAAADSAMGRWVDADSLKAPVALQPLPVLGIPGWWPGSADEMFYSDTSYFRAGRRS